jgi:phosphoribosyl-ATP pyrophosphohydrolase/phosphoribosyl-AMP cyclohydrolase
MMAQGADTCFYQRVDGPEGLAEGGDGLGLQAALSTLFQLEATIEQRRTAAIAEGECGLRL